MKNQTFDWCCQFTAWSIVLIATAGSLFFSEVMLYPPCLLCWYQRIAMYPLTTILLTGLFSSESQVFRFALPLTLTGWGISIYHNLLYYELIPESAQPCNQGISCTTVHFVWLNFITIPLLSTIAFTLILILLTLGWRSKSRNKNIQEKLSESRL